jgi:hypothetical protein
MMTGRARLSVVAIVAAVAATALVGSAAVAGGEDSRALVRERLSGYQEDPLVLSTTGTGTFIAWVDARNQEINYRLSYSSLEGTVTQAHIHIGGKAQSGGISTFLCANVGTPPAGTQACPPAPATITGTITPANIIGPAGQGVAPGEFDELIAAFRAGVTYVNVHSTLYPTGEIRAQLGHH